jgi:Transglutaminase-like superfamily
MHDQYYYLPQHVYACRTDEGVIFLDAKHDRYFGLGGAAVCALPEFIKNWTGDAGTRGDGETPAPHVEVQRVAANLIERGLLRRCADEAVPTYRNSPPPLAMDLPRAALQAHRTLRLTDLLHFTTACTQAYWFLKRLPLEAIASRVTAARRNPKQLDIVDIFGRVQVFRRLRRLFFSEKDRCLLNALALVLFLKFYGHFPLFVIGVKTRPFGAHSWVQHDQILLDGGDPSSVCHFVPILVA